MGLYFEQNVHEIYPEFGMRRGAVSWEEYLPPLDPTLAALVEQYDGSAMAAGTGA